MPPAAAGITVAGLFTSLGITAGLNLVLYALTPKPRARRSYSRLATELDAVAPWQVIYGKTRVGGTIVYVEEISSGGQVNTHFLIAIAGHEINDITGFFIDDKRIPVVADANGWVPEPGNKFASRIRWQFLDGSQTIGFGELSIISANYDSTEHRFEGHSVVWAQLANDPEIFPGGLPSLTFEVEGKNDVYDPRDTTNKYTSNAALIINDYLTDGTRGVGASYADDINEAELIAEANISDEQVDVQGGGTQNRYEINGAFRVDSTRESILRSLLTATGGSLVYISGNWIQRSAYYRSPTIEIDETDLAGPVQVQPLMSRREVANAIHGIHPSVNHEFIEMDYPPVKNALYESEDGERIWKELDFPFTTSPAATQRLAKIELERGRQQITVKIAVNLSGYQFQPGDTVQLTLARYGWTQKPFEIVDLTLGQGSGEPPPIIVRMTLRETAAGIFDWAMGEETTVDLAPDTDLEDIFSIQPPSNLALTSDDTTALYVQDNVVKPRIKVEWDESPSNHVHHYDITYRDTSEGVVKWRRREHYLFSDVGEATVPEVFIEDVTDTKTYIVRVRAVSRYNTASDYVFDSVVVSTQRQIGNSMNMLFGGDFDERDRWQLSPTTLTPLTPNAETSGEWTNPAQAFDGLENTAATSDPPAGTTQTAIYTVPGSGPLEGAWLALGQQKPGVKGSHQMSFSTDGGSTWTNIVGSFKSPRSRWIQSQFIAGNRELFRFRITSTKLTGVATSTRVSLYEVYFGFIGATGVVAQVGARELALRGTPADYGAAWRAFPGFRPEPSGVVFKTGSSRAVFQLWATADSTPDQPIEVLLRDSATETVWGGLTIPFDKIEVGTWYAFADLFEPVADVVGDLEWLVRTKSTAIVRVRRASVRRGNLVYEWEPNPEEIGYQGDEAVGSIDGYPPGPWTPGTPKRSSVS